MPADNTDAVCIWVRDRWAPNGVRAIVKDTGGRVLQLLNDGVWDETFDTWYPPHAIEKVEVRNAPEV